MMPLRAVLLTPASRQVSLADALQPPTSNPRLWKLTPLFATDPKNLPVSPIIATLPKTRYRKSFVCHTYDPLPPPPLSAYPFPSLTTRTGAPCPGKLKRALHRASPVGNHE